MKASQEHPLVSIQCMVYNHEPYLRQCLDGFVMQRTNFKFEAIVHDDVSTDGSAAIIREYAEKYPDIIKPIYETENQYSKKDGSLDRIMREACNGKYIAICEGDDFWFDPLKLQEQVDFLDANPEYSMCFHNAAIKLEDTTSSFEHIDVKDREYCAEELFMKWVVPTASIVIRTQAVPKSQNSRIINGDINIVLSAVTHGRVMGLSQCMSVYRIQTQGLTIKRERENRVQLLGQYIHHYKLLYEQYPKIGKKNRNLKLCDTYVNLCTEVYYSNPIKAIGYLVMAIVYSPSRFVNRVRNLYIKVKNKKHYLR